MKKGFTLVEIMIVVAIIALLAAIAIPNLLRSRISAQEAAAAAAMHTIVGAEVQYRATHSAYSDLAGLGSVNPPYIDSTLAAGIKQGYVFTSVPVSGLEGSQFTATAVPQVGAAHGFYVDESGVLCRSDNNTLSAASRGNGTGCPAGYSEMQ